MTRITQWIRNIAERKQSCFYTFQLDGVNLVRQLQFEEFLYRKVAPVAERCVFFLTNNHNRTGTRAVVMGISGKEDDFVKDPAATRARGIAIVKRFTGGGTVIVDECSINTSVIASTQFAKNISPTGICKWSYENVFKSCGIFNERFDIVEGDFVVKNVGNRPSVITNATVDDEIPINSYHKVAGNSQAFNNKAFVHHSVFLWSISPLIPQILKHPKKTPNYRAGRDHMSFLRSVREVLDIGEGMKTVDDFELALCKLAGGPLSRQIDRKVHVTVSAKGEQGDDIRETFHRGTVFLSESFLEEAISMLECPTTVIL